jgi:molecular chaperone GrpE
MGNADDTTSETPDEGGLEPEDLQAAAGERIAALEKEKQETYDRLLRTAADLDNFRKRSRKDLEEARLKAREEILREILPGIDNLERAVAVGSSSGDALVEGVRLVLRQFHHALERFDIRAFDAGGAAFDPTRHEAIAQIETADHPPGTVVTEMQRGYTIGPRLLRPALVAVAKAPVAPPAPEDLAEPEEPEEPKEPEEQGGT